MISCKFVEREKYKKDTVALSGFFEKKWEECKVINGKTKSAKTNNTGAFKDDVRMTRMQQRYKCR